MSDSPTGTSPDAATPASAPRPREQWSGQLGFILAAVGSAVGLGNIWRFPGTAYDNGGGAFLIPYLVALATAGIPILWLDYSLGHRFRGGAPAAFRRLWKRSEALGWFQVGISVVIALYYTVIIAWAASYVVFAADQRWGDDPSGFLFGEHLQVADPGVGFDYVPGVLLPLIGVWVVTLVILAGGVKRGIERANLVMIPLLVVIFLAIVIRSVTLEGAADGLNAFFTPDWEALAHPEVWMAAYAQVFFSLSIAFGIMITYSSYLRRRDNLTTTGLVVGLGNSSFELLAGIGVFAAIGYMAGQAGIAVSDTSYQGIGLAFIAFPQILSTMPGGSVFGVLFFASLLLAGMTSLISILQVVSAAFQDKFGWSPRRGALSVGVPMAVVSSVLFGTTTGLWVLDIADKFVNEVGVLVSAIASAILVGLITRKLSELRAHLNNRVGLPVGRWWTWDVGLLVPVVLTVILVRGLINLIGDGYDPATYADQSLVRWIGWGTIVVCLVIAALSMIPRWRHDPDAFVPEQLPDARPVTEGAAR